MAKLKDLSRMLIWLAIGLALYLAAYAVGMTQPTIQVVCQKLGNVTTAAWVGYWIARVALGRLNTDGDWAARAASGQELIARALIILAAILGVSMGL